MRLIFKINFFNVWNKHTHTHNCSGRKGLASHPFQPPSIRYWYRRKTVKPEEEKKKLIFFIDMSLGCWCLFCIDFYFFILFLGGFLFFFIYFFCIGCCFGVFLGGVAGFVWRVFVVVLLL